MDNYKINQSAINYTGGKFKLLPQILPFFPKEIDCFYDVFLGGANISINLNANKYVGNDISKHVIDLYKYLSKSDFKPFLEKVEDIIIQYELSNTKLFGYEFYNTSSQVGLKDVNKKAYLKLRKEFNDKVFDEEMMILVFYILIVFGFNNQIRFNSKGDFNIPTGKRDFNIRMETKLKNFMNELQKREIKLYSLDFRDFFKEQTFEKNDFVYLDPPYLISNATYNEKSGWTKKDEVDLLKNLDKLNEKNIKFALSNIFYHKGEENKLLIKWANNYNVYKLDFNYNNSNYQSKAKSNNTIEVLITNY